MPAFLQIEETMLEDIRAAVEAAYPDECCGLLVGRPLRGTPDDAPGLVVSRVVAAANIHPQPARSFELDPQMHIFVLRQLRELGDPGDPQAERVIGHYHSHPDTPAYPSPRDAEHAHDPDLIWCIASVARRHMESFTAWQICLDGEEGAEFRALPVSVTSPATAAAFQAKTKNP